MARDRLVVFALGLFVGVGLTVGGVGLFGWFSYKDEMEELKKTAIRAADDERKAVLKVVDELKSAKQALSEADDARAIAEARLRGESEARKQEAQARIEADRQRQLAEDKVKELEKKLKP